MNGTAHRVMHPTRRQRHMARVEILSKDAATNHRLAREALRATEGGADRMSDRSLDRKLEKIAAHAGAAAELRKKAEALRAITQRAIYRDDPDILERLEKRLQAMLARREGIRQYNASCRRGMPQQSYLTDSDQRRLAEFKETGELEPDRALPPHVLRYLTWDIAKVRQRITGVQHKLATAPSTRG